MATIAGNVSCSSVSFIKTTLEFENKVKSSIAWSKKQWLASGESGTRFNKLINSLNYWKSKLKPAVVDTSILFTLYNMEQDVKVDLLKIITCIENLDKSILITGFSDFRNPRYICIYFKNKEERDIIEKKFKMLDNSYVVPLAWALDSAVNVFSLKVHWLPKTFDLDAIKDALSIYVKCIEEERVSLTLMSGRDMPSGKVFFKATVNEGHTVESIPHLMMISQMEALITIPGRQPLCLNCEALGHISKKCKLRFCGACYSLQVKDHICTSNAGEISYAAVVKESVDGNIRIDPDDWSSAIETESTANLAEGKEVILKKILTLERQIKGENVQSLSKLDTNWKTYVNTADSLWSEKVLPDQVETSSEGEEDVEIGSALESDSSDIKGEIGEAHMNVVASNSTEIISKQEFIKVTRKKKKKKTERSSKVIVLQQQESGGDTKEGVLRSYGKPVYNTRRRQADEKFEKAFEKREFIFKD